METSATRDEVAKHIFREIKDFQKLKEVTAEDRITVDLGVNSLDILELQMNIEEKFKTQLSTKEEDSVETVGDLVNVFWARVQDGTATCPKE